MAAVAVRISHKKFRALIKKHRRKLKRQLLAKSREEKELKDQLEREKSPCYWQREAERQREEQLHLQYEERERERMHRLWLVREQQAQAEFRRKKELAEQETEKKNEEEEEEEMPKEEEKLQDIEKEKIVKSKETQDKKRKEDALKEAVASLPEGNEPWHNPLAPENYNPGEKENCSFFMKTGCCRFGDRCSRSHLYPSVSCTLLIKGMFSHFSIGQMDFLHDEYDADIGLEFDDKETYQDFLDFYEDVLPEFKKLGKVVQFKVCCNHEPHLRGNVYIQYSKEKEAEQAYAAFNGRWYAGKQISCEYTNVIKWKGAICGLFHRNRCPKGKNCNFLHVFKNPQNEFWAADNDIRDVHNGSKNGPYVHRNFRSSGCYKSRSRSPAHNENSQRSWRKKYSPEHFHHRRHHHKLSSHSEFYKTKRYTSHLSSSEEEQEYKQLHSRDKRKSHLREHRQSYSRNRRDSHLKKQTQSLRKQTTSTSSSPSSQSSFSSDEKSSSYSKKKSPKRKKRKEKKFKKYSRKKYSSSSDY